MRICCLLSYLLFCFFTISSAQETLRKYADLLGLNIGVAIGTDFGRAAHDDVVKAEFNAVVAENNMKSQSIHPSKGKTNFGAPDNMVKFAQDNNMKVRGHTLIWHRQCASWIHSGSKEQIFENMKYHIETMMDHYKGKIFQWDVVNEAFEDGGPNLRSNSPFTKLGTEYIDSAFVFAHRADPEAKLFYNDFSTSSINAKSTAIYNMIKKMLENGIPIHGIGFQSHQSTSDGTSSLYAKIKENFQRFADLGLEIAITELDVKGSDFDGQAIVYSTYMKIALEMPEVTTYMIWGVRDGASWVSPTPLIFDDSFRPKKAYQAILEVLKDPPVPTVVPKRQIFESIPQNDYLIYDNFSNSITLTNSGLAKSKTVTFFNLAGAKTASLTISTDKPLAVSSINIPAGTVLIRSDDQVLKIQKLR